jgi:hypothetical protein
VDWEQVRVRTKTIAGNSPVGINRGALLQEIFRCLDGVQNDNWPSKDVEINNI